MRFNHFTFTRDTLSVAIAVAVFGGATPVFAQQVLEEVVVTAQKRAQTLQEIPVAVSAFSSEFIADANIGDLRGLVDLTPGFSGKTEDGFIDALAIRGIVTNDFGIGGDPSVAIFTDGVWQGRNGGAQMAFYDIERVEVVKGPQATLFGRNAIAGAVSIITKKPIEEFEASISLGLAEYSEYEGQAMVNVPLSDNWYFRGNVYGMKNDGFLKNISGGDDLGYHDLTSTRLALRYEGESLDATFSVSYENRDQDPSVYWDPELGLDEDEVNIDLADRGFSESEIFSATANVSWDFDNGYSLHSITGYKTFDFDYLEDYDARPVYVNHYRQNNRVDYYSQELRLNFEGDKVSWFVGASAYEEVVDGFFQYLYNEDDLCNAIGRTDAPDFSGPVTLGCNDPVFEEYWGEDLDPADILADKAENSYNDIESNGYAIYGDATWSVTDRLDLTVGARYTFDKKDMRTKVDNSGGALGNNFAWEFYTRGFMQADDDWNEFTPRVAVNYELNEEVSLYANVSSGYKAGGFGTFGITVPVIGTDEDGNPILDIDNNGRASAASVPTGFDPETSISYEVGAKSRLLDDTLQLNAAFFFYTYEDLQLLFFENGSSLVENLGEAENMGVEVDAHWLIGDHFDMFFAGSWMDSEITDAEDMITKGVCSACDGKTMPFAPDWSYAVHLTYRYPMWGGEVSAKVEYAYQGDMYSDLDNIESITVNAWGEWGFRAGYKAADEKWGVSLYLENAFNEEYFERGWANGDTHNNYGYGITNTLVWPSKPRTFGASVNMYF